LKDLIEYVARALVDAPDQVRVQEFQTGDELVFELRVAADDLGKVIGKKGRTARALRTLLSAAATKKHARAALEIVE
jgi:predicted RNA-binding protein YlqC (UPF0109 family)